MPSRFSDVFREYRKGALGTKGLRHNMLEFSSSANSFHQIYVEILFSRKIKGTGKAGKCTRDSK